MKLIDALANLDADARLSDGRKVWTAADLIAQVAATDESDYDTQYLRDGRFAIVRVDEQGIPDGRRMYVEMR